MNRYLSIILLYFLTGIFTLHTTNGYAQSKDKKEKKQEHSKEQVKQVTNISALIDAKRMQLTGNLDKAEEMFREYCLKYPDDPVGYFELGRILASTKNLREANEAAAHAARLNPENIWYQLFLAETEQLNGNYKDAISVYEKIITENPDNLDHYYQLASLYLSTEQYPESIQILNQIEERIGISEEISIQKEKIYLYLNEISKAGRELEKLVSAFPDDPKYISILAEFYMANKMPEKALEQYKRIVVIDPANPYIHMSLADYYRKIGDKGKAYSELKLGIANPNLDINSKVNILLSFYTVNEMFNELKDEAYTLAGILVETHPNEAIAHSVYADLLLQDKKLEEAREEFIKVVALDSSRYVIWEEILQLDLQLEKYDHLQGYSKLVIELFPEQPLPYLFSGIANYQLKDFENGAKDLNRGLKMVVNNDALLAQFYMYLGDTYHALKNMEESDKAYQKSLEKKGDNPYVLNNYSYYLAVRNIHLEKAEKMAKQAVTLEPDNSSFQDTYGWVLYRLGRFEEAKTWIAKALESKEQVNAEVLEHYGDVLYQLGDTSGALDYWLRARNKGQGSEFLDKKIAEKKLYE